MKNNYLFLLCLLLFSCSGKSQSKSQHNDLMKNDTSHISVQKYTLSNRNDSIKSMSIGTVSEGRLEHGKLVPYKGNNFKYFDSISYVNSRGYLNDDVLKTLLSTYESMENKSPNQIFTVMECSNKEGGKIYPHRTHQNGLSIDFMVPLVKDNQPYYGLDSLGGNHYLLGFDDNGCYLEDKNVIINFDLIALHILELNKNSKLNKLKISKVILKIELKDELFKSKYGEELKASGIYFAQKLSPIINELHDDHYHIDFEKI